MSRTNANEIIIFTEPQPVLDGPHLRLVKSEDESVRHVALTESVVSSETSELSEFRPTVSIQDLDEEMDAIQMHKKLYSPLMKLAKLAFDSTSDRALQSSVPTVPKDRRHLGGSKQKHAPVSITNDTVGDIMRGAGRFSLIDKETEHELARTMRRGKFATARIFLDGFRAIGGQPPMYAPEEKSLTLIQDALEAKDAFICANLRLVISIATKYQWSALNFEELIQEGNLGLEHAVDLFDETKGHKFSTYATNWIGQYIRMAIADRSHTIRIPRHAYERSKQIYDAYKEGRSISDIALEVGLGEELVEGAIISMQTHEGSKSLDDLVGDKNDTRLGDLVGDSESATGYEAVEERIRNQLLMSLMDDVLDEREKKILQLRFGLDRGIGRTLEEVAREFDMTRERIRQLEKKALDKIRASKQKDRLADFI